jgi:hypothetical protein
MSKDTTKDTPKPTPAEICLATANDQVAGKGAKNTSVSSTVSITNTTTAPDASDGDKMKKARVKDSATVSICNQTDALEEVVGGCGAA